ncbi:MAG: MMPL family transporter [Bacteroidales bacterium]|nr:MMPL family transporter [Bacteroidales bacterium]
MQKIFLPLYRYFRGHKAVMYTLLIVSTLVFLFFGLQLRYEEDVAKLLPRSSVDSELAFSDIELKDKIFIQITSADPEQPLDTWTLSDYMDEFCAALLQRDTAGRYIIGILSSLDPGTMLGAMDYGFEHLPSLIDTAFYAAFSEALDPAAIDAQMARNRALIDADMTGQTTQMVCTDPLDLRDIFLARMFPEGLDAGSVGDFTMENGHFFCPDRTVALAFLSSTVSQTDSGTGTRFARILNQARKSFEAAHPDARVLLHGNPLGGVSNASTIKTDLVWTIGISLLIILVILLLCFHRFRFVIHLLAPVLYGTIFALACVYWIKGIMSFMALGIGAIILGVALSYCLHVLIHYYFVEDVERMLREESTPVVLGCLTTIGAFLGLLFTESDLLRDFGLFATFALLGNTIYALVFLPHFLRKEDICYKKEKGFKAIDRFNNLPWDRKPWILGTMTLLLALGIVMSPRVKFDTDLRNLNFVNKALAESQDLYSEKNENGSMSQYYAAYGETLDEALECNKLLRNRLDSLEKTGLLTRYSSLVPVLFQSQRDQEDRIAAWKAFWTPERIARTQKDLAAAARKQQLDPALFAPFFALLESDYEPANLYEAGVIPHEMMSNFVEHQASGRWMVFSTAAFNPDDKDKVNDALVNGPQSVVLEPFYYCRDMVQIVHDDFQITLLISSIFVLLVLLLAFRNLWIALVAFFPMFLSWYALQGFMALLGLQFNLINIVIATFVFGIGVDYSIFVMEGLLQEARTGSTERLAYHKVAIFFSAVVLIIVIGSLVFARHPAIESTGVITLIGMIFTILMTYSLEPFVFRWLMRFPYFRRQFQKDRSQKQ